MIAFVLTLHKSNLIHKSFNSPNLNKKLKDEQNAFDFYQGKTSDTPFSIE